MVVDSNDTGQPLLPLQRFVLYIGTSVPLETTNGLEAIQQPLREHYPIDDDDGYFMGVDSVLTILPNGIQLQYKGDDGSVIWFPIATMTMCAAVRCVHMLNVATGMKTPKFVSLSSPAAGDSKSTKPSLFALITRRMNGRRVLECHAFVCQSPRDAMDLVQSAKLADSRFEKSHSSDNENTLENASKPRESNENIARLVFPPFQQPIKIQSADELGATIIIESDSLPPRNGYFYSSGKNMVKRFMLKKYDENEPKKSVVANRVTPIWLSVTEPSNGIRTMPTLRPPRSLSERTYINMPYVDDHTGRPHYRFPYAPIPYTHDQAYKGVFPPPNRHYFDAYHGGRPTIRNAPLPLPPPIYAKTSYNDRVNSHRRRSNSAESVSRNDLKNLKREEPVSDSSDMSFVRGNSRKTFIHGYDTSSDDSLRASTPPADYEATKSRRLSRKEKHDLSLDQAKFYAAVPLNPLYRQWSEYFRNPHPLYDRAVFMTHPPRHKSAPAYDSRTTEKAVKTTKAKKSKVKRKKHPRKRYESSDSYGYTSELPTMANGKLRPSNSRNSIWTGNMFGNEKAFSKSLMRESANNNFANFPSAYALNKPDKGMKSKLKFVE